MASTDTTTRTSSSRRSHRTEWHLRRPVDAPAADRSFWLQDAPAGPALPALAGDTTADVVIVGGGLTGLWTALRIREAAPEKRVVVLEALTCGSGASGRNGGQVHSWYESLDRLTHVTDAAEAERLARATSEAIDELHDLQSSGELDMGLRLDGWLWTASSRAQEGAWDDAVRASSALGVDAYTPQNADTLARSTGSTASYVGVRETHAGSLHPGKLMRGLRALAERRGVVIHEHTPVDTIRGGPRPSVVTPMGTVTADAVLVATNVWASSIPELRRRMFVVDSEVIATEPIPERLDALGWTGGEAICDAQQQVLYYQRTADGRIVFGRGSGRTIFADRVGASLNRRSGERTDTVAELHRVFPKLSDVRIDYDWTGGIDCVPEHVPIFGALDDQRSVFYAVGWNGTALAQIPACSRIIASMVLKRDDEWSGSKLIDQTSPTLPPEPIRFIGANFVRAAVVRKNRAEIRNRRPGPLTRLILRLMPGSSEH